VRKIIEYTLMSIDGIFADEGVGRFFEYRDDAYLRDGLGQLMVCDAMLMGRTTYDGMAKLWPGRSHPWADRLNAIQKYVSSSKLERAERSNSTIVRSDVVAEVIKLKQQDGGHLRIWAMACRERHC
jgi:dihydrofolate reductase